MNRYAFFYFFLIRRNLLSKYSFDNINNFPNVHSITLGFDFSKEAFIKRKIIIGLLFLFLISEGLKGEIIYSKLRGNDPIGCKLILNDSKNVNTFLEKFVLFYMKDIYDFSGFSIDSFSESGNLSITLKSINGFPEIEDDLERFAFLRNLKISFVFDNTNLRNSNVNLLQLYNIPFKK